MFLLLDNEGSVLSSLYIPSNLLHVRLSTQESPGWLAAVLLLSVRTALNCRKGLKQDLCISKILLLGPLIQSCWHNCDARQVMQSAGAAQKVCESERRHLSVN